MIPRTARPYLDPYLAGALLGLVLFAAFFVTGNGLGASGGIARVVVAVEDRIVPDHVDRVPALLELAGGETAALDSWIVWVTLGTLLGGFLSGLLHGRQGENPAVAAELSGGPVSGGSVSGGAGRQSRSSTTGSRAGPMTRSRPRPAGVRS